MTSLIKKSVREALSGAKIVLVGVSGGMDSICLLHMLCGADNVKVVAVHLNHCWRGVESDADEVFVRDFCAQSGVEFYSEKLSDDCPKTETAARDARYDFFDRCLKRFDADVIFLAHNKNDNVETLVYRLIKGTGIEGLKSIPKRRGKIIRPLLEVTREEIEEYMHEHSLKFREDMTNSDTNYNRNYIRHKILPKFAKVNPNFLNNIENLIEVANNECEILVCALLRAREEVFDGDKMRTEKFLAQIYPIKLKLIYNYLKDDLKFYDLARIKRIVDFIIDHAKQEQDPQYRTHKRFSINSKLFLYVNKKEIFKGE